MVLAAKTLDARTGPLRRPPLVPYGVRDGDLPGTVVTGEGPWVGWTHTVKVESVVWDWTRAPYPPPGDGLGWGVHRQEKGCHGPPTSATSGTRTTLASTPPPVRDSSASTSSGGRFLPPRGTRPLAVVRAETLGYGTPYRYHCQDRMGITRGETYPGPTMEYPVKPLTRETPPPDPDRNPFLWDSYRQQTRFRVPRWDRWGWVSSRGGKSKGWGLHPFSVVGTVLKTSETVTVKILADTVSTHHLPRSPTSTRTRRRAVGVRSRGRN